MQTISEILKGHGFYSASYELVEGGFRNPKFLSRPPYVYCGWQSVPSAPIVRSVPWCDVFDNNQRIKISEMFQRIPPVKPRFSKSLYEIGVSIGYKLFKKYSPLHSNSNKLEFQYLLVSFEDGCIRSTTVGDVLGFDFASTYVILHIDENTGFSCLCKESDFEKLQKRNFPFEGDKVIMIHTALFLYVDHVTLIFGDSNSEIIDKKSKEKNEVKLRKLRKTHTRLKLSRNESTLIKEFIEGKRNKHLLFDLLGCFLQCNIEIRGGGKDYSFSWKSRGKVISMSRLEVIDLISYKINRLQKKIL